METGVIIETRITAGTPAYTLFPGRVAARRGLTFCQTPLPHSIIIDEPALYRALYYNFQDIWSFKGVFKGVKDRLEIY